VGPLILQEKRDNTYFLARLQAEQPDVWDKYQAGDYTSVRAALLDAGLLKQRNVLPKLKTLWGHTNATERAKFLVYLQHRNELTQPYWRFDPKTSGDAVEVSRSDDDRSGWRQLPLGRRNSMPLRTNDRLAIINILRSRGWIDQNGTYHVGQVIAELERNIRPKIPELAGIKFKTQDPSLSHALKRNWKLRPALLVALEEWLKVLGVDG